MSQQVVMGIDPGLANCGYGVIALKADGNTRGVHLDSGVVMTVAHADMGERLLVIDDALSELIERHQPQALAMEALFFAKNVKSATQVGMVCGVVALLAARHKIPFFTYTPLQIKQAIACYGRADKNQVETMVKLMLGIKEIDSSHSADALAAALCHSAHRH